MTEAFLNMSLPDLKSKEAALVSGCRLYCPAIGCTYANGSKRFFTSKRSLNQHVLKVHAEKKYSCSKCHKGFAKEFLRKGHEKFCGMQWHCSCGNQYLARESLLTHARRSAHAIIDAVHIPVKRPAKKNVEKQDQPLVIIVQPIIQQQVSYVIPGLPSNPTQRLLLPKQPQPVKQSPPTPLLIVPKLLDGNLGSIAKCDAINHTGNLVALQSSGNGPMPSTTTTSWQTKIASDTIKFDTKQKLRQKTAVETQTCADLVLKESKKLRHQRKLESRGSQCSGRIPAQNVMIESTHTQTMESAVVKMKKKSTGTRSRRRSVAVITDADLPRPTQELWCNFEDFMLSVNENERWLQADKSTTSTQTTAGRTFRPFNKVFCDSETTTDSDMLQLNWSFESTSKLIDPSFSKSTTVNNQVLQMPISGTSSATGFDIESSSMGRPSDTELAEVQVMLDVPDGQSSSKAVKALDFDEMNSHVHETSLIETILNKSTTSGDDNESGSDKNVNIKREGFDQCGGDNCANSQEYVLDFMFDNIARDSQIDTKPLLSDIQTQTGACESTLEETIFDLANMETQTTEELLFSELEFLDTETQTPWDDLPNLDDVAVPVDQLSIEIQTDFAPISSYADCFKNGVFNSVASGNKGSLLKVTHGKHMETQTHDVLEIPELTHSEAQTLSPLHPL